MDPDEENRVKAWLKNNEGFSRSFVQEYLDSHPLYLKEIIQHEKDKKQQQNLATTSLSIPNQLTPKRRSLKHVRSVPNVAANRKSADLRSLNKQELFMELLKDAVSPNFDVNSLSHKILVNVLLLTSADRSSLFLVEGSEEKSILVSRLFDVTLESSLESVVHNESDAIKIPFGVGIVGRVAQTGTSIILEDAYTDSRFNTQVDKVTGYHTKAIMCMPIKTTEGQVIGVAQVINKIDGKRDCFTKEDEEIFMMYLTFCAIGLVNMQLFQQSFALSQQLQTLLHLARGLFEDATSLPTMVRRVLTEAQELIPCQKALVLLLNDDSNKCFSQAFELETAVDKGDSLKMIELSDVEDMDTALQVVATKELISTTDVSTRSIQINRKSSSVLCMPIFDKDRSAIGAIILKDKLTGLPFSTNDEDAFKVFATFCGLGVQNVINYEEVFKANAKQTIALEVLSYHATASEGEVARLMQRDLPNIELVSMNKFEFDDYPLTIDDTILCSIQMFSDLDLINKFHIDTKSLYRWVLTVKRNYRPVTYHNWRHAFNVAQSMYCMMTNGKMGEYMSNLEQLSLLIACLCHDLDHRGTNNAFQVKTESPLAQLYSTSTMEHHHFDHSIMILTSEGNRILDNLSSEEYKNVIGLLESAILSTDLAIYFRKKGQFADIVNMHQFDWNNQSHRDMLRGMMMTACDIAAITKPWPIQSRVAELVASEFFEQGDRERQDLNIEPIAMMDRRKKDELPKMQVGFIDSICLSLYEILCKLEPGLSTLYDGCKANKDNWQSLADKMKDTPHITHATLTSISHTSTNTQSTGIGSIPATATTNGSPQPIENQREIVATTTKSDTHPTSVTRHKTKCIIS